ncbi:MAG: HEWD family protein [Haloplanus sp.]
MPVTIRRPTDRRCERCGRHERWNDASSTWRIAVEDGERVVGNVYCLHDWDINGTFVPIEEELDSADA